MDSGENWTLEDAEALRDLVAHAKKKLGEKVVADAFLRAVGRNAEELETMPALKTGPAMAAWTAELKRLLQSH